MRFKEIKESPEQIMEVPMNPGAYADSLTTAVDKGVKIGFEFEVCVPHATIVGKPKDDEKIKDSLSWVSNVGTHWWTDYDIGEFSSDFATIDPPVEYNGKSFTNLKYLANAFIGEIVANDVKKIFDTLPTVTKKKFVNAWNKQVAENRRSNDAYQFGIMMMHQMAWGNSKRQLLSNAVNGYMNDKTSKKFWTTFFGSTELRKILTNPQFKFDLDTVRDELGVWDDDEDDDYGGGGYHDYDYEGASKVMEPVLRQAFGKVKVFNEYHQSSKDTTTWYIEPDGSLEPDDNDGACEIVTPPLPVAKGIEALKTFYGIAKQMNLYTSVDNHTGLHINVSIPQKLDILKLAMFVGDEHVLKSWDREDNDYANSVIKQLKGEIPDDGDRYNQPEGAPVYNLNKKGQMKDLLDIAKNISDDHMASVSMENGNKYVSFRHAGGDYLNKQDSVLNVVGRFVRAMVIAADPNAYRKEYLAKLTKLVTPTKSPQQQMSSLSNIMALRTQPFDVVMQGFYGLRASVTPQKLMRSGDSEWHRGLASATILDATAAPYLEKILAAGVAEERKEYSDDEEQYRDLNTQVLAKIASFPNNRALVVHVLKSGDYARTDISNIGWNPRVGVQVTVKDIVQPGTPLHDLLFKQLYMTFKDRMKAKMLSRKAEAQPAPARTSGPAPRGPGLRPGPGMGRGRGPGSR